MAGQQGGGTWGHRIFPARVSPAVEQPKQQQAAAAKGDKRTVAFVQEASVDQAAASEDEASDSRAHVQRSPADLQPAAEDEPQHAEPPGRVQEAPAAQVPAGPSLTSASLPAVAASEQVLGDVSPAVLLAAVKKGDVAAVGQILGSSASSKLDLGAQDTHPQALGCTALHYAVLRGRTRLYDPPTFPDDVALQLVGLLLAHGAPVNATDQMGFTPLHLAAAKGSDEVVAELLSYGAFMDVQDTQIKYTPLHAAVAAGNVGAILLMIEAGALVDEEVAYRINCSLAQDLDTANSAGESGLDCSSGALGGKSRPTSAAGNRASLDMQVHRSALSVLQKGRTESVLPNGGGRLWALKDVTGMGIWDVLDSPATACGVLDVLLQDLSHVDLIGARSMVQLLQQTQSLQYVIGVAQKAVASEAALVGLPTADVAGQLDTIRQYLVKAQHAVHQQALRNPQRGRLPLPAIRPAMLGRGRDKGGGGGGGKGPRQGSVISSSSSARKFKTGLKAGGLAKGAPGGAARGGNGDRPSHSSVIFTSDQHSQPPLSSVFHGMTTSPPESHALRAGATSGAPGTAHVLPGGSTRSSNPSRVSSLIPAQHVTFTAGNYVPGQLARVVAGQGQPAARASPPAAAGSTAAGDLAGNRTPSGRLSDLVTRISTGLSTGLSQLRNSFSRRPSEPLSTGLGGGPRWSALPPLNAYASTALASVTSTTLGGRETLSIDLAQGSVMGTGNHDSGGGSGARRQGPVGEGRLWPINAMALNADDGSSNDDPDPEDGDNGSADEEDSDVEAWPHRRGDWSVRVVQCDHVPHGYGSPSSTQRLARGWEAWQYGGGALLANADEAGSESEAQGEGTPGGSSALDSNMQRGPSASAGAAGPLGEGMEGARLPVSLPGAHAPQVPDSSAAQHGMQVPPPPPVQTRVSRSGRLSRLLEGMMSHRAGRRQALQQPKTAPPQGFKVWTHALESKLQECVRCIQWQSLKLEQFVEAVLLLARDTPSFHYTASAPRSKGRKAGGPVNAGNPLIQRMDSLHLEDDEDGLAGVEFAWEVVRQAINLGDKVISHMLVDRLVYGFPRALLRCPWSSVMVDMCQAFPHIFHHLLGCLKDVSEEVRTAFVTSFNLADLEKHMQLERAESSQHGGGAWEASGNLRSRASVDISRAGQPLPPQQQNSQSLKGSSGSQGGLFSRFWWPFQSRGLQDSGPLSGNTLAVVRGGAHNMSMSHPLSGVDRRMPSVLFGISNLNNLDMYSTVREDAASFKYTLYRNLVEGLRGVDYTLMKCFVEKLDQGVLQEMAQMSVYKDFVSLLPSKLVTRQGGGPDIIQEEMGDSAAAAAAAKAAPARNTGGGAASDAGAGGNGAAGQEGLKEQAATSSTLGDSGALTTGTRTPGSSGVLARSGSGGGGNRRLGARRLRGLGSLGKSTLGGLGPAVNETKAEVLLVDNLLRAALAARSAESVQACVESLVAWVEMNARNRRLCFIDGLTTALVSEMATHFPSAAAALFNISPQASRDIKVSSYLLNRRLIVCQCSHTRYSFMWRQSDLEELDRRGWSLNHVEMLADNNMRFMYICRAAQQGCSVDDVLELMDLGLLGQNVADLVSSGAQLAEVKDAIERGLRAEVVSSMLGQKLPWQLVEVLLHHRITRTTLQDRTLRLDLLQVENDGHHTGAASGEPTTFSHAFVTRFLEKWAGARWEKAFLDKVFHASDTLCTKLKTAYDYKLSMRTNYLNTRAASSSQQTVLDWPRHMSIMSAFLQPAWLLSHWVTAAVFLLLLTCVELGGRVGRRSLLHLTSQEHTVDATAKVLPIINAATLGRKSLLAGLMYADVPSQWYGTPVARAVVAVQWDGFAQVLMAMHLLEHVILMVLYAIFLLLMHNSLTAQQELLYYDGSPRSDPQAGVMAQASWLSQLQSSSSSGQPSPLEPYPLGDLPAVRDDILQSGLGMACLVGLLLFSVTSLATRLLQLKRAGLRLWTSHLANHLDVLCSFLCLATVVDFLSGDVYCNILALGAVGALVMFMRLTLFSSIVERMGSLVRTVTEIMKDLRYFFILLAIIFGGFALAFSVQQGGNNEYRLVALQLFTTMTSDFQASMLAEVMDDSGAWLLPNLALALWILYGFVVGIVLVALLISIMNDTFDRIKDAEEVEVLRNKARIIVDLQMLLTSRAMQQLQAASLGPFLHTLSAGQTTDSTAPGLARVDEWQGRMQQLRKAISAELQHYLGGLQASKRKPGQGGLPALRDEKDGALAKDVSELHVVVKAMRGDLAQLARTVAALSNPTPAASKATGPTVDGPPPNTLPLLLPTTSTAAGLLSGAGSVVPAGPGTVSDAGASQAPHTCVTGELVPLEDLQRGALSVLGHAATLSLDGCTAGASPAILSALEGATMLHASNLPGRYFNREIPSVRGPNAASQTMWRIAAKLAAEQPLGGGLGTLPGGAASFRMMGGSGAADAKAQSGMLTRFAVTTLTSLGKAGQSARVAKLRQLRLAVQQGDAAGGGAAQPQPQQQDRPSKQQQR